MPRPQVFTRVAALLERRIEAGDYLLSDIPGERRIAEDAGVSHMTARKAVSLLLERSVLVRRENGSLGVNPSHDAAANASIALLYPSAASPHLLQLRHRVVDRAESMGRTVRPVQFVHWDDPIVRDAIENPGGVIVIPSNEPVGSQTVEHLRNHRAIFLDGDLSDEGVPSIRLFPNRHINQVFEEVRKRGHRRIACLNTEAHSPEVLRRLQLWDAWAERCQVEACTWDEPARGFADPMPIAYDLMKRELDEQGELPTAIIGITFPAAVGAARACWERGLSIGRDISFAAINVEPPVRYMTPAILGLELPGLAEPLGRCMDWFAAQVDWRGSHLLEPSDAAALIGESVASL